MFQVFSSLKEHDAVVWSSILPRCVPEYDRLLYLVLNYSASTTFISHVIFESGLALAV